MRSFWLLLFDWSLTSSLNHSYSSPSKSPEPSEQVIVAFVPSGWLSLSMRSTIFGALLTVTLTLTKVAD